MDISRLKKLYLESTKLDKTRIYQLGELLQDNGYGTLFIKPNSEEFSRIEVTIKKGVVSTVSYVGDFEINIEDLIREYGTPRKAYSAYDDSNFYFFLSVGQEFLQVSDSESTLRKVTFININ